MVCVRSTLPVATLIFWTTIPLASASLHFQEWYPTYGFIFDRIIKDNCTRQYDAYIIGKHNDSDIDWYGGGDSHNQLAQPVVGCILDHCPEFIKVNMAAAGVLLGLTPFVLASLGSSAAETSLLFVIGRRPLLALGLIVGSPAVFPARAFEFQDPVIDLMRRTGRIQRLMLVTKFDSIIVIFEYLFTFAAIVNIVTAIVELGVRAPLSFSPETTYISVLWGTLGCLIHLLGVWALYLRGWMSTEKEEPGHKSWGSTIKSWLVMEFMPRTVRRRSLAQPRQETNLFLFLSWLASLGAVCHFLMGTLVFSSVLFISTDDSLRLIGRLMASVICCRIVLMFELTLLGRTLVDARVVTQAHGHDQVGGMEIDSASNECLHERAKVDRYVHAT
jgi:hypothetical protein